jgi:rhodanese-related sulfurtransferase
MNNYDQMKAQQFFTNKITFTAGPVEVNHMIQDRAPMVIVDVRAVKDYQAGHVPGAINLPQEKWDTLQGLQKDKKNILYCYSIVCHLAAKAGVEFAAKGFPVVEMEGGFKSWQEHKLDIESSTGASSRIKQKDFGETPSWDQPESGTRW